MTRRTAGHSVSATARAPLPPRAGRQCDCLLYCGDDQALHDGRADPCADKVERDRTTAEAIERMTLQRDIAADRARRTLRLGARTVPLEGCDWFTLQNPEFLPPPDADVTRAARYLLLMRLAEQHPTQPHLLRLITTPPRDLRSSGKA